MKGANPPGYGNVTGIMYLQTMCVPREIRRRPDYRCCMHKKGSIFFSPVQVGRVLRNHYCSGQLTTAAPATRATSKSALFTTCLRAVNSSSYWSMLLRGDSVTPTPFSYHHDGLCLYESEVLSSLQCITMNIVPVVYYISTAVFTSKKTSVS